MIHSKEQKDDKLQHGDAQPVRFTHVKISVKFLHYCSCVIILIPFPGQRQHRAGFHWGDADDKILQSGAEGVVEHMAGISVQI